jgi:hypothetical protein
MSDWQRLRVATHDAKYTKASITRVSGEWLGIPACLDTSAPKSECHGSAVVFNYTTCERIVASQDHSDRVVRLLPAGGHTATIPGQRDGLVSCVLLLPTLTKRD